MVPMLRMDYRRYILVQNRAYIKFIPLPTERAQNKRDTYNTSEDTVV